ncbi:histidinol-phosphatase [Mycolicibacter arupensis]|uniref:Histidinol-phosphatase n=3 Tax=Mycolicibacter arupensis TaxID=342002 RepID=A0ABX3S2U3_9MYCO|nr:histidinol-phosphatase [Mycolicibacter arupensis]KAA1431449.1 histidinol-phosphatase [Mycolicibacter arupensis]MCV7276872.1 histidinol-phosphatase [Mycolicibacter arupensis]ORA00814.1 histidinol-phosphatase [Mycolicibacter arupensis]
MGIAATSINDDLTLALALADLADAMTMDRFGALDLRVDTKPDLTPVTDADRAVEVALRDALARDRPDDDVLGEEFGGSALFSGRQWVIDPIDGTKNFVRGVPVWATLISLLDDGVPRIGVISAPALGRRWWAGDGLGAFAAVGDAAARRLAVSAVADLSAASLSFAGLKQWAQLGLRQRFLDLTDSVWRTRSYGDFWAYCLLAEGALDVVAEPTVSLWDLAALDVLVREAGGAFTDLSGTAGPHGGSAVASNSLLQAAVLDCLGVG